MPENTTDRRGSSTSTTQTNNNGAPSDNDQTSGPAFTGPGGSATAPRPPRPHSTKMMNKADPRFNEDILETVEKERDQDRKDEEELDRVLSGTDKGKGGS